MSEEEYDFSRNLWKPTLLHCRSVGWFSIFIRKHILIFQGFRVQVTKSSESRFLDRTAHKSGLFV